MLEAENNSVTEKITAKRFANLVLDMGTLLLASGAHCGRVGSNLRRLSSTWGFELHFHSTFTGLLVSVVNNENPLDSITSFRESPTPSVHFEVLTRISALSWEVYDDNLSIDDTEAELDDIRRMPNYKPWVISLAVGLSCACLTLIAQGNLLNAAIAWLGASLGSIIRFKVCAMKFNPALAIGVAAFVTTMVTGLGIHLGTRPEAAMAIAVLYLIPGVPLVNCVIDLIDGYFSAAVNRALYGGTIVLCIAVGMTLSILLLGISNFK